MKAGSKVKSQSKRAWVTRQTLADVFGVTAGGLDKLVKVLDLSSDAVAGQGTKDLRYHGRAVLDAWRAAAVEAAVAKTDGDPMLSGSASPALERYRDEKAKLAKLDRLEREGTLVEIGIVHRMVDDFIVHLRRASERLQTECGDRAYEIYVAALAEAEAAVARHFAAGGEERDRGTGIRDQEQRTQVLP